MTANDSKEFKEQFIDSFIEDDLPFSVPLDDLVYRYDKCAEILSELGKQIGIVKADMNAIIGEINSNHDEESALKARAIIGRWIKASSPEAVTRFIMGTLMYGAYKRNAFKIAEAIGLSNDDTRCTDADLCCVLAYALHWYIAIEIGTMENDSSSDMTMPDVLPLICFIAKYCNVQPETIFGPGPEYQSKPDVLKILMECVCKYMGRYQLNREPHPADLIYAHTVKAAFLGKIESKLYPFYKYCNANNTHDWNLFTFLTNL